GSAETLFESTFGFSLPLNQQFSYHSFLGIGPGGTLLLEGSLVSYPGATVNEVFEYDPVAGTAARITSFTEARNSFPPPSGLLLYPLFFLQSPLVAPSGDILLTDGFGDFYRIDYATGDIALAFETQSSSIRARAILPSDRIVANHSSGGSLVYELDGADGSVQIISNSGSYVPNAFSAATADTVLTVADNTRSVQLLNIDTGEITDVGKLQGSLLAQSPLAMAVTPDGGALLAQQGSLYRLEQGASAQTVLQQGIFLERMYVYAPYDSPTRQGDFDQDGDVDSDDLQAWAAAYGASRDGADFLQWQRAFQANAPIANAVPEPTSLAVLAWPLLIAARRRRPRASCRADAA
ncbi:MAG: PQQ-like beta-propeller repeat protein, partial [Planctomycetales bacterium]|nr:PQQ-like beta-propeller repeat protein [Planctomycetales bacterium]